MFSWNIRPGQRSRRAYGSWRATLQRSVVVHFSLLHPLTVSKRVSHSSFLTLEALACSVAHTALVHAGEEHARATIRAAKPHALRPVAAAAEVEISRTLGDYENGIPKPLSSPSLKTSQSTLTDLLASVMENEKPVQYRHRAALALGANLGDRFANIELALRLLETPPKDGDIPRAVVVDTSFMYETAPMYVTDQPEFINCACMVCISSELNVDRCSPGTRSKQTWSRSTYSILSRRSRLLLGVSLPSGTALVPSTSMSSRTTRRSSTPGQRPSERRWTILRATSSSPIRA